MEQTGEVPSFADRLGERLVVPQPSGALLEFLQFRSELSAASFFEPAVKTRLKRLSNFRHAAYARATRLQRDPAHGSRLTLVSAYTPGRRLADVILMARRGGLRPEIGFVVALTRQLMTGVALLHDYAPDVFHGAISPERLVLTPDGRLVITEYVLGDAVEQGITEWGSTRLWRDCGLAVISDRSLPRFGRRLDLVQIGLVALSLIAGRPLGARDFPDGLADLIAKARETTADGESIPLGADLSDWLARMLHIDPPSAFRTLIEAQKAFARIVDEEPRYAAAPGVIERVLQRCEEAALLPLPGGDLEQADTSEAVPEPAQVAAETPLAPAGGPSHEAPETGSTVEGIEAADPFGPWPVVVGSDTVATLFETFRPQASERESHVVSIPDEVPRPRPVEAGESPSPARPIWPETVGEDAFAALSTATVQDARGPQDVNVLDATGDWMAGAETATARQLRETLFEAEPLPTPAPATSASEAVDTLPPPPIVTTPSYAWSPPAALAPAPEPPAPDTPAPPAPPPPHAEAARMSGPVSAATQRRQVVLSYDELHKPAERPRSRGLLIGAAAAVVLVVVGLVAGPRLWKAVRSPGAAPASVGQAAAGAKGAELGGFKITTQPPGGRITVDGQPRGTAPVRIADLAPGLHSITVESDWGSVDDAVTVEAGKVTPLVLSTVGYIKINAPVELHVSEQGRSYGTSGKGPLMVPAGRHHFDLANQAVAVRLRQFVEVAPGTTTVVPVELPAGMLNLKSDQPAEVLLDGQPIGETPLLSVSAPLGSHEVIFRSAKYGEVSYTVNVTLAAPVRLTVTFNKR